MARHPGSPDDFDTKLRKLGNAAYVELRKKGMSEAEFQKTISEKKKRKLRRGKKA